MHILPEFFTENNSYINVLNVFGLASSVTLWENISKAQYFKKRCCVAYFF
jgi:hypothetical protein